MKENETTMTVAEARQLLLLSGHQVHPPMELVDYWATTPEVALDHQRIVGVLRNEGRAANADDPDVVEIPVGMAIDIVTGGDAWYRRVCEQAGQDA